MNATPGERVVCINTGKCEVCATDCPNELLEGRLEEGRIYTVADYFWDDDGGGYDLVEVPCPISWMYCAQHFRPILDDKCEPCETEFVTLLQRSNRKVKA